MHHLAVMTSDFKDKTKCARIGFNISADTGCKDAIGHILSRQKWLHSKTAKCTRYVNNFFIFTYG
jgi:hypothetical protein